MACALTEPPEMAFVAEAGMEAWNKLSW
jgi:hypothetical protein